MLHYIVKQYTDDIYVYTDTTEYLTIKRSFNLMGKLTSVFSYEGRKILETGYDIFLFRKYFSILYQELPAYVELEKTKGNYLLIANGKSFGVRRKYFKNPLYQLYSNGELKGVVNTKVNGLTETPILYNVLFDTETEDNFYLLLLFLINLPPTMDV